MIGYFEVSADFVSGCLEFLSGFAAVASFIATVFIHRKTVERQRKIETIAAYSAIREKQPVSIKNASNKEIDDYLLDMEFFCVGINNGIYDVKILKEMSGKRLLGQYEEIKQRKSNFSETTAWSEYIKVMERLASMYE